LLTDALGSVIAQANDDQNVQNFYSYSPYGEARALGSDDGNSLQYTQRENDQTGLYFYRARYYDPVLKRFISEDPIGLEGGVNLYAYVDENPINFGDPLGLQRSGPRGGGAIKEQNARNKTLQDWPEGCSPWWPASCYRDAILCLEAECTTTDCHGNKYVQKIYAWIPSNPPANDVGPGCVCTRATGNRSRE
jgi:RHS repeat-associated protein